MLVTGASGGLGAATTRHLAARGWHVFAADYNQEALGQLEGVANVTTVIADVLDATSVAAALEKVAALTSGLDAVVNFAGILSVGSMMELDEDVMQRVLNVNVMGTFRVNQACFPLLLARKGRVVNLSSETGWQSGGPFNGAYASSKHAIEAYTDSLRRELALLDMPVIKIQPGPFKTDMVNGIESNFTRAIESSSHFKSVLKKMKTLAVREGKKGHDPMALASVIETALSVEKPKSAYSVKPDFMRSALEYIPVRWADALLKQVLSVK